MSVSLCFFFVLSSLVNCHGSDRRYWEEIAKEDLEESLLTKLNTNIAKNVILFIADGMGPNTVTASRIFKGGETSYLAWERFPHLGNLKTYNNNKMVTDSASSGTALFTGVKTNYHVLGSDPSVKEADCSIIPRDDIKLTSLATLAQDQGKATGIVTTTRVTHATPAAMYAHILSRKWECDAYVPPNCSSWKDIGRQLIEDAPGRHFNVIMGGGRQSLKSNTTSTPGDPVDPAWTCSRKDGRNLIEEWAIDKAKRNLRFAVVNNTKTLLDIDSDSTDYLMGIFANEHFPFEYKRNRSKDGMPSLEQMTIAAINVLKNNQNGFLLMVEGGMIDMAHHRGKARKAVEEVLAFNDAINGTMQLLDVLGMKDETLVIVTSDHGHTLTISGYPERGSNIFGIAMKSKADGVPFTTLLYANSGPENYHYKADGTRVIREDPSTVDTTSFEYGAQASVVNDENTHGGGDVLVYATGPFAHLFHRVHELHYVTFVVKYAARLGEYANIPPSSAENLLSSMNTVVVLCTVSIALFILAK